MVMGVCRQILRRAQDAEDAFQATFLILVRKARSIQVCESLAPWLYSVAYRTAQRARASGSRFRQSETDQLEAIADASDDLSTFDLRPLLHEELGRLPDKYRSPIVLCHLEGKSHEEAARMLDWPVGTVSGRLSRGRLLLKSRLERRGLAVPSAMLAGSSWNLTQTLPESMVESTVTTATRFAAAQSVSTGVLTLTHGVLRAMLLGKLKTASLALLAVAGLSGGALAWARRTAESPNQTVEIKINPATQMPPSTAAPIAGAIPGPTRAALKYIPTLAEFGDPIPVFGTGSILLVEAPDGQSLEARSVDSADAAWQKLALPTGVHATPVAGDDTLALMYEGESINQLAAFSAHTGEWKTVELAETVHGKIWPVIGPGSALYQSGSTFYAFSSQTGKWDVLKLTPGPNPQEKPRGNLSPKYISVQHGDRIYAFSLKHGKWSHGATMKLPAAKKAAPAPVTAPQQ